MTINAVMPQLTPHLVESSATYPPVIKHGNGKWAMQISDFPMKTSIDQ